MSVLKEGLRSAAISIENETVSVAYNGTFVKWPPSSKLTLVGFFVPGGYQRGGDWSTSALVRDLDWSLPVGRGNPASAITARVGHSQERLKCPTEIMTRRWPTFSKPPLPIHHHLLIRVRSRGKSRCSSARW